MRISPRPGSMGLAGLDALFPCAADQDSGQIRLRMEIQGASAEADSRDQNQHRTNSQEFHNNVPARARRSTYTASAPKHSRVMPNASKKESAVPVAGAPKTLPICMPSGHSVGTRAFLCSPLGFTMTCSTATSEVN